MHRARWMARVLYPIKMVLFQSQIKMTRRKLTGLEKFVRFAVIFYVRNWFAAPSAPKSPKTDLQFLQKLKDYDEKDVSAKALCRHLWYLNEELVPLAFFDDEVNNDMKLQMVQALDKSAVERPSNRISLDYMDKVVSEQTLASFITSKKQTF